MGQARWLCLAKATRAGQDVTLERCSMQQQQVASYLLNTVLRAHVDTCPTFAGIQSMSRIHHCDVLHRTPYSKKAKRCLLLRGTSDFSHKKEKKGRKKRHFNRHLVGEGRGLTDLSSAVFREFSKAHCKHFFFKAYAALSMRS